MASHIPEKDWKKLRSLQDEAIQAVCDRVFDKVNELMQSKGTDSYGAYKRLWQLLKREDKQIALMFDDLKRSTAVFKLAMWRQNGLLSDADVNELSESTQKSIAAICESRD